MSKLRRLAAAIAAPFAGMTRIRFEGSPTPQSASQPGSAGLPWTSHNNARGHPSRVASEAATPPARNGVAPVRCHRRRGDAASGIRSRKADQPATRERGVGQRQPTPHERGPASERETHADAPNQAAVQLDPCLSGRRSARSGRVRTVQGQAVMRHCVEPARASGSCGYHSLMTPDTRACRPIILAPSRPHPTRPRRPAATRRPAAPAGLPRHDR